MTRGVRALPALVLAAGALAALPAHAQSISLAADHPETGWIRLRVAGVAGSTVDLSEQTAAGLQPIAEVVLAGGRAVIRHAGIWRCDSRTRSFVATAHAPDGTAETARADVTTPSCAHRLLLSARAVKHRRTRRVQVALADRFKVGDVGARLCLSAPAKREACHSVALPAGRTRLVRSYRASGPGVWSVALQTAWKEGGAAHVYIRPPGRLHLLATGDSMIEILDTFLRQRLGSHGIKVRGDSRISTGISKPFLLDWTELAARQARSLRPDVTVVFIGANDGFPIGGVNCCGDDWVGAYAARAHSMMASYARHGRGLVYWLTLPAPQPEQWKPIYPAVNRAIRRAATGFDGQVRVVDIAKVISPGFRFRTTIRWHGRRADVRQGDGVHLSVAGASIAEQIIQRALRADGVI